MAESLTVRNATAADLDAVMRVEAAWPEDQRATRAKFESRLERCPAGFLVAELDGAIVGTSTSCLTRYDRGTLDDFTTWDRVTNEGFLHPPGTTPAANALYVVSTGILHAYRQRGVGEALIRAQVDVARRLGVTYVLTGAILLEYDTHCRRHGDVSAVSYALVRRDGRPVDPLLSKLEELGFVLPDERHVIPHYYPSAESRDYGALVVHELREARRP